MSLQETIWSGVLENRINDIRSLIENNRLPNYCGKCGDACDTLFDVLANHQDFWLVVPVSFCKNCVASANLQTRQSAWQRIQNRLQRVWNGLVRSDQGSHFEFVTTDTSDALVNSLFDSVPAYRELRGAFPTLTTAFIRGNGFRRGESGIHEAQRFMQSIHVRVSCLYLISEPELTRSGMPSEILGAFIEAVDNEIIKTLGESKTDLIVQVGATLLPNRKWEFDCEFVPESSAANQNAAFNRLRSVLYLLPTWPVMYPVIFAIRRGFGFPSNSLHETLGRPFPIWKDRISKDTDATYAEMAMKVYGVQAPITPTSAVVSDIEALEQRLPNLPSLKLARASVLLAMGRNTEALELYTDLVEKMPDDPGVFHQYLYSLAETGQIERAAYECQQRISRYPNDATAHAHLAKLQSSLEQPTEALKNVDKALSLLETAEYFQLRAALLMDLERYDEALWAINVAIFLDRDLGRGYFLRGRLHLRAGRFEESLVDLIQCDRCMGRSFESLQMQATALVALGRVKQAEQFYRSAIAEAPNNMELKLQWIDFLVHTGKVESARQECDALISAGDEMGMAHAARSLIDFEMGQLDECIHDADHAIRQGSDGAKVYLVRGIAKAAKGQLNEGLEDLDFCVEKTPEFAAGHFHRGRIRMAMEEFDRAVDDFTAAIELIPDWTDALVERGFARLGLEDHQSAKQDFDLAIERAPERSDAYTGRALALLAEGKKVAASEDLNKALVLDPHNLRGRLNRAKLSMEQSDMEMAKDDLNEILAAQPEHAAALWHRAHVRLFLGHFAEARTDFDRLVELNPILPHPLIGRSVASELAHDIDKAEADREEAWRLAPYSVEQLTQFQSLLTASVANSNEQFELASELATQMIDESPVPPWDAYRIRGHARWYSENYVEALEDYTYLIENCEDATRYDFSAYGQVLGELGEYEKGLDALDRSIEIAKEQDDQVGLAFSFNGRGRVLVGLNRLQEAEDSFIESLKIKPDNAWLHYNRGMMFFEQNESTKALACFELALCVESPKLPPGKRRRASGFIQRMRTAPQ